MLYLLFQNLPRFLFEHRDHGLPFGGKTDVPL